MTRKKEKEALNQKGKKNTTQNLPINSSINNQNQPKDTKHKPIFTQK
jgi:hypothetical protein